MFSMRPSVSTRIWYLTPLTFLPHSQLDRRRPLLRLTGHFGCPPPRRSGWLPDPHAPARAATADNGCAPACHPTPKAEGNRGRYCVAADPWVNAATGSRFPGHTESRPGQPGHPPGADGHPAAPGESGAQSPPTPHRSNRSGSADRLYYTVSDSRRSTSVISLGSFPRIEQP